MEKLLHISGEIGWENTPTSVKDSIKLLALKPDDTLRVIINSEGGSVFDGFDIYNQLKALDNEVITEVRGMAASIASLIMLAGDTIEMSQASTVMIHRAMTMAMGNSEEIEKQIKILNTIDSILVDIYVAKTGLSREETEEKLSDETWYTGEEAVEAGLADTLIHLADAKYAAQLLFTTKQKKMALKDLFKGFKNDADLEEVTTEETQEEVTNEEVQDETAEETQEVKNVTREEFDALVAAMESLAAAIDALTVEGEETETTEEETTTEEQAITEDAVEEMVENKLKLVINNLRKSNGKVTKGNNSLTGGPNGYVDKYASFRAKQADLDAKTRN